MGQNRTLASEISKQKWAAKLNVTEILALIGLIVANLVSIFSKAQDRPLTQAQSEKAEADAALALSQGWQSYANQINDDNRKLREEMELKAKACSDEIAALREKVIRQDKEIDGLKKQINGGSKPSSSAS